jgi:transcriptional regulator with PAS, ATPase and Fis domain
MVCFDSNNGLSRDCIETILQSIAEGLFIVATALRRHTNNYGETAHDLGIDRTTLWRLIKKWRI